MIAGPPIWFVLASGFIFVVAVGIFISIIVLILMGPKRRPSHRHPRRSASSTPDLIDPANPNNPANPLYLATTGQVIADTLRSPDISPSSHLDHSSSPSFPTDSGPSSFPSSHESGHSSGGHH